MAATFGTGALQVAGMGHFSDDPYTGSIPGANRSLGKLDRIQRILCRRSRPRGHPGRPCR